MSENQRYKFTPAPFPYTHYQEDEIDLKELIKTILKYKKFIIIFTVIGTLIGAIFAYTKTPIYEIKANLQPGYIIKNLSNKKYFFSPTVLNTYIKSKFDQSYKSNYPQIESNIVKKTDILSISIQDYSNKNAINDLRKILDDIHQKEIQKINFYKKTIMNKIDILNKQKNNFQKEIKILKQNIHNIKDPNIYQLTLSQINQYQNNLVNLNLQIEDLKKQISPLNIKQTYIVGDIKTYPSPIKPKKKLIIIISFILSLTISIISIFIIEFIKELKTTN